MTASGVLSGAVVGASPYAGIASGVASGLFGGLFGKGGGIKYPAHTKEARTAMRNVAASTDFDKRDAESIAQYKRMAQATGMDLLEDYDAMAGAGGSPIFRADSRKDASRALIASKAARDASAYALDLYSSSPFRKQQLWAPLATGQGVEQPGNAAQVARIGGVIGPEIEKLVNKWFA